MYDKLPIDFGESDDDVVADRALLEHLFSNLYNNTFIYHERITILSEVVRYEVTDERFTLFHRPVKLLRADAMCEGMYERWQSYKDLEAGANLSLPDHPYIYTRGRLSMAYGPGKIWPGARRVEYISKMSDDDLVTDFNHVMWGLPKLTRP